MIADGPDGLTIADRRVEAKATTRIQNAVSLDGTATEMFSRMACPARGSIEMRNIITNSSIANVARFSEQATVMFRDGNTGPAMWHITPCAGKGSDTRVTVKRPLYLKLDPVATGSLETGYLAIVPKRQPLPIQPASPASFQRIS